MRPVVRAFQLAHLRVEELAVHHIMPVAQLFLQRAHGKRAEAMPGHVVLVAHPLHGLHPNTARRMLAPGRWSGQ